VYDVTAADDVPDDVPDDAAEDAWQLTGRE